MARAASLHTTQAAAVEQGDESTSPKAEMNELLGLANDLAEVRSTSDSTDTEIAGMASSPGSVSAARRKTALRKLPPVE